MAGDSNEAQDFIDRAVSKRIEAGLKHIGAPALGRILRIAGYLQELGQRNFATLGLTILSQDILINLLIQGEPYQLSPKALAEATFMSSGGMSNALERLEKDGLLERRPDPNDRRGVLVTLTPKGRELITGAQPSVAAMQHSIVDALDEAEMERLNELLRKLLLSLEEKVRV